VGADDGLAHTYSVAAITLNGLESPQSATISTADAQNAWW
jgi:hypothetical protein